MYERAKAEEPGKAQCHPEESHLSLLLIAMERTMQEPQRLPMSDAEREVLLVLWDHNSPMSAPNMW